MQIKIGDQTIEVSIDYYEPASAGSWDEPPSPEYIEWSAKDPVVAALIDMSSELQAQIEELVCTQRAINHAEDRADYERDKWLDAQGA